MKKKLPLAIIYPTLLVMALDLIFTLAGQSSKYWTSFTSINESSPLGYYLLSNPLFFIVAFIGYLFLVFFLLRNVLPKKIGFAVGIAFFIIHVWGSSSWVDYLIEKGFSISLTVSQYWIVTVTYLIIISIIFSYCYYPYLKNIN